MESSVVPLIKEPLPWRHNELAGVSNHQPYDCLLNRLFRRRSKKTSKLCVTGLCVGNSPGPVNSPHKGPVTRKMFPFDNRFHVMISLSKKETPIDIQWVSLPFIKGHRHFLGCYTMQGYNSWLNVSFGPFNRWGQSMWVLYSMGPTWSKIAQKISFTNLPVPWWKFEGVIECMMMV